MSRRIKIHVLGLGTDMLKTGGNRTKTASLLKALSVTSRQTCPAAQNKNMKNCPRGSWRAKPVSSALGCGLKISLVLRYGNTWSLVGGAISVGHGVLGRQVLHEGSGLLGVDLEASQLRSASVCLFPDPPECEESHLYAPVSVGPSAALVSPEWTVSWNCAPKQALALCKLLPVGYLVTVTKA